MALQKSFDTAHGVTAANAYHKIGNMRSHKDNSGNFNAMCMVQTYYDEAARTAGKPPLATRSYRFAYDITSTETVADNNLYVQGYAHLKTLDEFSGAIDV